LNYVTANYLIDASRQVTWYL